MGVSTGVMRICGPELREALEELFVSCCFCFAPGLFPGFMRLEEAARVKVRHGETVVLFEGQRGVILERDFAGAAPWQRSAQAVTRALGWLRLAPHAHTLALFGFRPSFSIIDLKTS